MSRTIAERRHAAAPRPAESTDRLWPPQSRRLSALLAICALACVPAPDSSGELQGEPEADARSVRAGIEVLLSDSLHLVAGRRVGLITNHTGIYRRAPAPGAAGAGRITSTIDGLHEAPEVELVALYAPEHGIRGDEDAGARIDFSVDERTGTPIHSLYGETRRPTPDMLEGVEALLFDMQDVGSRYYTYVSTMALAMEAAGEAGIPFIVLDRPNPIRGDVVQGNVLEPEYATFVGLYPVPMRHGMTAAELARLYVGEFGIRVDLRVVPMDGWRRSMTFADTGLDWLAPSPNMPSLESALAYPGTCLFEGTPLSVGRGTDRAFQWIGAPWLDGEALAETLGGYGFEGVRFEPVRFTPGEASDGKFVGREVQGVRLIAESSAYDAPSVAVAMLIETRRASGEQWGWRVAHFDRLAGTDGLRLGLEAGQDLQALTAGWSRAGADFETLRAPYLIYP